MKNFCKKITAIILVFTCLVQVLPVLASPVVLFAGTTTDVNGAPWRLYDDGTLVISAGLVSSASTTDSPWIANNTAIQHIRFEGPIETGSSLRALFGNLTNLTTIEGLDYFNTSGVTTMHSMFFGATSLTAVDLSGWDISSVANFTNMFSNTHSLAVINTSGWDTSSATLMTSMFFNARAVTYVDVSSWDTSRVTSMNQMFRHTHSLTTLDVSGWDTSNVTTMRTMFTQARALTALDVSGWDTGNVTNMDRMFQQAVALDALDVSGWNTSNVTIMAGMFDMANLYGLESDLAELDVSGWDTGRVISMANMFREARALDGLDVSAWDVSNVTAMNSMFMGARALSTLDVSNWDTGSVTNMSFMFRYANSINGLDVSDWDTSNVTTMSNMFRATYNLTGLDVSGWDTSRVTTMNDMFTNAYAISGLDVSNWDTARVTNMSRMFLNAESLTYLDVSNWDTSLVISMSSMFSNANSITALDVSNWDTRNVTDMSSMFASTTSLAALNVSGWQTGNVLNMSSMFQFAESLTALDVSNWDVSNVVLMQTMFRYARNIEVLDVSNWDTSSATRTDTMFRDMRSVTVLDVSNWDVSNVTRFENMFHTANNVASLDFSNWDTSNAVTMTSMLAGTAALQRIHFGEDFSKPAGANLALPNIANIPGFTRNWIKITPPEGTPYLTSAQLIPTAGTGPYLPGIWVWERVVGIVLLSVDGVFRFPTVAVGYGPVDPLYVTVSNAGRTAVSANLTATLGRPAIESDFILTPNPNFQPGDMIAVGTSFADAFSVVPRHGLPAGTYTETVTVTGAGINTETFLVSFIVLPDSIENAVLNFDFATFDGTEKRPDFTVTLEGVTLIEGVDFVIVEDSWTNNVNAATWDSANPPSVTIRGIGSFAREGSEATGTFTIARRPITLAPGTLRFTKVYDGTMSSDPATHAGNLAVSGLVQANRVRVVWDTVSDFSNSYVDTHEVTLRGLQLESVDPLDNWHLNFDLSVDILPEVPANITPATLTSTPVTRTAEIGAARTIAIPLSELTPVPTAPMVLGSVEAISLLSYTAGPVSTSATISGGYLTIITDADKTHPSTETITVRFDTQNFFPFNVQVVLNTSLGEFEIRYNFDDPPTDAPAAPTNRTVAAGTLNITPSSVSPSSFAGYNNGIAGTWTFSGWSTSSLGANINSFTMPNNDVVFTGDWEFAPSNFEITYTFSNTAPAGAPTVPNSRTVAAGTLNVMPSTVSPASLVGYYNGVVGTWIFSGWSIISDWVSSLPFTMPNSNVEFTGSWSFTTTPFTIYYNFTNAPDGAPTVPPSRVISAGTPGVVPSPVVPLSFVGYHNGIPGTWTFGGWSADYTGANAGSFTMPNNNVSFTGGWTFTADIIEPDTFEIRYTFINTTPGSPAVPQNRTLAAGTLYVTPSTVSPSSFAGYNNGVAGTWTFSGWSADYANANAGSFTMPNNDVNFTGGWTFTANELILPPDDNIYDTQTPSQPPSQQSSTRPPPSTTQPSPRYDNELDNAQELQPAPIEANRELHLAYMFGDDKGDFRPNSQLTRAEAATIMARISLLDFEHGVSVLPPGMTSFDAFTDVQYGQWFYFYIAWAYDAGLVTGFDGHFMPNDPITREEFAALVVRAATTRRYAGESSFLDIDAVSNWAINYVDVAYFDELMIGDPNRFFRPQENITRAEAATAMNRLLGRIDSRTAWYAANVENLGYARIFPDVDNTAWYFPSVIVATNDHYLTKDEDGQAVDVDLKTLYH